MPRQKLDKTVSKHPRAKRSRPKETELTPVQKRRDERKAKIDQIRERQARYRELPTSRPGSYKYTVQSTLVTIPRHAYPEPDDYPRKRARTEHVPRAEEPTVKEPVSPPSPSPSSPPAGLATLPSEICDEILRHLLLWPPGIPVFYGWSRVLPRSRPKLDVSILQACRVLCERGLRILYGENTFIYDTKDPSESHKDTAAVLEKVIVDELPIVKFGHLIRFITLKMPSSRIHFHGHRSNFKNALRKFLPGEGFTHISCLHTLTLEISAVCNRNSSFKSGSRDGNTASVPICQFLEQDGKIHDWILELRIPWVRVLAQDEFNKYWETKIDMRCYVKDEHMKIAHEALVKREKRSRSDGADDHVVRMDPVVSTEYRPRDIKAAEERWDGTVKRAIAGLRNMSLRISLLATEPHLAVDTYGWWQPVEEKAIVFVSLPEGWREPSSATNTRRGRQSKLKKHSQLDSRKRATRAKPQAKPDIGIAVGRDILKIGKLRDDRKEMKLLEAQRDTEWNKAQTLEEQDMLTKQWLESLPEHGAHDNGAHEGDCDNELDCSEE